MNLNVIHAQSTRIYIYIIILYYIIVVIQKNEISDDTIESVEMSQQKRP